MLSIKVNIQTLYDMSLRTQIVSEHIGNAKTEVYSINASIPRSVSIINPISNELNTLLNRISSAQCKILNISRFLSSAADLYNDVEKRIQIDKSNSGDTSLASEVNSFSNWKETFAFNYDKTSDGLGIYSSGAAAIAVSTVQSNAVKDIKSLYSTVSDVKELYGENKPLISTGIKFGKLVVGTISRGKVVSKVSKDGKYIINSGYKKATGLGSRYKKSTYIKNATKLNALDVVGIGIDIAKNSITSYNSIKNTWSDPDKDLGKKLADTTAVAGLTAISVGVTVGGKIASKAVTAITTAAIPIPVVGTAVGLVAGAVVEFAADMLAETLVSEAVVNQVSDSIENVGNAVVAGGHAIGDAGKKLIESENVGDAIVNTAKLVGTAVTAGIEVVSTVVNEATKTVATVVTETAKNIGNTVASAAKSVVNFFKKW